MQLSSHTHISCMYSSIPLVSQPSHCTMSFYESGLMQHKAHRCQLSRIGQDCPRLPLSRKETAIVIPPWYNSFSWLLSVIPHYLRAEPVMLLEHPHNNLHLLCIGKHGGRYELLSLHWNCVFYTFLSWNLAEKVSTKLQIIIMAIAMQQHRLSYRQIQHCRAASKHLTLIGKAWVTWKVNLPSLWIIFHDRIIMQTFLLLWYRVFACSLFDALSTNRANLTILLYLLDFVLSCRKG